MQTIQIRIWWPSESNQYAVRQLKEKYIEWNLKAQQIKINTLALLVNWRSCSKQVKWRVEKVRRLDLDTFAWHTTETKKKYEKSLQHHIRTSS